MGWLLRLVTGPTGKGGGQQRLKRIEGASTWESDGDPGWLRYASGLGCLEQCPEFLCRFMITLPWHEYVRSGRWQLCVSCGSGNVLEWLDNVIDSDLHTITNSDGTLWYRYYRTRIYGMGSVGKNTWWKICIEIYQNLSVVSALTVVNICIVAYKNKLQFSSLFVKCRAWTTMQRLSHFSFGCGWSSCMISVHNYVTVCAESRLAPFVR